MVRERIFSPLPLFCGRGLGRGWLPHFEQVAPFQVRGIEMAINIYFDDIKVGDKIPAWSRKTNFMNWNRYAAVNDEFIFIHMDDEAGRKGGNEQGAFVMGNLRFAYILNALRDWIGDEARIPALECQVR